MPIFSPKTPTESSKFTLDFDRMLGASEKITGASATCKVLDGTDPAAAAMVVSTQIIQALSGAPYRAVSVTLANGVAGCRYAVTAVATTDAGQSLTLAGDFFVQSNF